MGKLDAAAPDVVVNGPDDAVLDWDAVAWRRVEDDVRRLRQRIFTASKAGDLRKVRNLQKLILRSRSNALLSVRRVTEVNADPHRLSTSSHPRHPQPTGTSACPRPSRLARAGCGESPPARFLGGGGAAMRRRYPSGGVRFTCWRTVRLR
jgi:N-terminal domain of reverse transcriptase